MTSALLAVASVCPTLKAGESAFERLSLSFHLVQEAVSKGFEQLRCSELSATQVIMPRWACPWRGQETFQQGEWRCGWF